MAFSYPITASHAPTAFSAAHAPANLQLDELSGIISGIPLIAGTTSVTLGARNAAGADAKTLVLTIAQPVLSIAVPAAVAQSTVSGTSVQASVLGAYTGADGEHGLSYTWSAITAPAGGGATFSLNGTNAGKTTLATFTKAGGYVLQATIAAAGGASLTSTVAVTVVQTSTALTVTPAAPAVAVTATRQFSASVVDQFGDALAVQPAITWTATGAGTISGGGLFTAATTAGSATVGASGGGVNGAATITVTAAGGGGGSSGGGGSGGGGCGLGGGLALLAMAMWLALRQRLRAGVGDG